MFAAGTDTIYITIEWILTELITHPSVMSKAQEEVRRVLGSSQSVTEEALNKMAYLKEVIREVLRMHPPIPTLVPREAMKASELEGYVIPKGTRVFINVWTISSDPMYWEKQEEFWPDRFLNSNTVDFKGQNFEFTPFGSGRRRCPGINFSMLTIECVVA
ncbi:cytochrome P450 71A1-like [Dendrobium catenatum]|nr:cytochrome P450 71A1-like [Dendrobium catenatum]